MENGVLAEIIEVEKEIATCVAAVEKESAGRLALMKENLVVRMEEERRRLAVLREEGLAAARQEGEREAEAIIREAREKAGRLARLDDARLDAVIARHLQLLLPEETP